jgi:hypothetical protein
MVEPDVSGCYGSLFVVWSVNYIVTPLSLKRSAAVHRTLMIAPAIVARVTTTLWEVSDLAAKAEPGKDVDT